MASKRCERTAVSTVFLLTAIIYIALVPKVWQLSPDSSLYMGLARSMVEGGGYSFNFAPHTMVPPVFPLMLGGVYLVLGQNIWVMQALVAVCAVGALFAMYGLVKARAGFWPALVIVSLTATNRWFLYYSSRPLSDSPYTFLSLALLWYAEREGGQASFSMARWSVAAILGIAAIYAHLRGVVLIPAVLFGILFLRRPGIRGRRMWIVAALLGLVWSGAVLYWLARGLALPSQGSYVYDNPLLGRTARFVVEAVGLRVREWAAAPLGIGGRFLPAALAAGFLALAIVPGLIRGMRAFRGCAEAYLCAYFVMFAFVFGPDSSGKPIQGMRYTVPVIPLLFYYAWLTFLTLREWAATKAKRALLLCRTLPLLVASVACIWGIGVSAFWACVIQRARLWATARSVASLEEVGKWAEGHMAPTARVGACAPLRSIAHFFTRRIAVDVELGASDTDRTMLQRIAGGRCDFLLMTDKPSYPLSYSPALCRIPVDFPECFARVFRNDVISVYRIEAQQLEGRIGRWAVP